KPDACPGQDVVQRSIASVDLASPPVAALVRKLVGAHVAVTSTLPIFETLAPGRPRASDAALDAMVPEAREAYLRRRASVAVEASSPWSVLLRKEMDFERAFVRAGGVLTAGTDPTGYGGVVAGFADQREIELLVEAGFSPVEAIRIATMN